MGFEEKVRLLLALYVAAALLDYTTTWYGISHGFHELNPLARFLVEKDMIYIWFVLDMSFAATAAVASMLFHTLLRHRLSLLPLAAATVTRMVGPVNNIIQILESGEKTVIDVTRILHALETIQSLLL